MKWLMPSGFPGPSSTNRTPLTITGAGMPVASRMVGTMSIMWWNWLRIPPASLITFGQAMTMPWRVPPKCEAI
jgi:hypothetical protein